MPILRQYCDDFVESFFVYRKTVFDSGFVLMGGAWTHGVWVPATKELPARCAAIRDPGFDAVPRFDTPPMLEATYRVIVGRGKATFRPPLR